MAAISAGQYNGPRIRCAPKLNQLSFQLLKRKVGNSTIAE